GFEFRGGGGAAGRVLRRTRGSHGWGVQEGHDSNWSACPYRPPYPDQQDRAEEPSDQVAEPSPKVDTKRAQYGAGNRRPDDTEHDIHHEPHFTLHKLFCEPACNSADDDGCDPAYLRVVHGRSPQKGASCA